MPSRCNFTEGDFKCTKEAIYSLPTKKGVQHFSYVPFFHKTPDTLLKRLQTDYKKANHSINRGQSFLSLSYLCLCDIEPIITQLLEDVTKSEKPLCRMYINKNMYIDMEVGW